MIGRLISQQLLSLELDQTNFQMHRHQKVKYMSCVWLAASLACLVPDFYQFDAPFLAMQLSTFSCPRTGLSNAMLDPATAQLLLSMDESKLRLETSFTITVPNMI